MDPETPAQPPQSPDQVKLAWERTFLAYERTMMAWIRTATSMITFGFALYKAFDYLHQERPPTHAEQMLGGRTYGMCIMVMGVFAIVLATWQYRRQLVAMRRFYPEAPASLSLVVAALIAGLGVLGFVVALFRL